MNLLNIIEEIEKVDGEIVDRMSPRREAMKGFFNMGSKIALAALPFAIGDMFKKAYGQEVPEKIVDVMNFALSLEHLEFRFYETALSKPDFIHSKDNIKVIRDHEYEHVKFLEKAITAAGATPVAAVKYDFTAKGTFPDVFSNYRTFLTIAQAFEDTGVRAYKGQAGKLMKSDPILQAALQIHSVEARHAAHIRFARRLAGYDPILKPWIVGDDNTKGTPLEAVYKGEGNHTQVIFGTNHINGYNIGDASTSAFDEPLDKDEVLKIVTPFFA